MSLGLPDGYSLDWGDSDLVTLRSPGGRIVGRYVPDTETEQIIRDAREDAGLPSRRWYCGDPECWICVEDGRVA